MRRTVAKIIHKGTYRVVCDDNKRCNPYTIYREWHDASGKHTAKLAEYQDMVSCMYHLTEEIIKR